LFSRTGYTGEDVFEIYITNENASQLWDLLLNKGVKPIGLGARDTLRFEACLPLYGHEISDQINPVEAGLNMFVKLDSDDFMGKAVIEQVKAEGAKRKLIGLELSKGIAREHYPVLYDGEEIGFVTTGYKSPTLDKSVALALVKTEYATMGNELEVQVRKKIFSAKVISKRFYKKNYKK
jgi:aminomethyltransferase